MASRPAIAIPEIELREATLADAAMLLRWRNDPLTRRMSVSQAPVSWADHLSWLTRSIASKERRLLIALFEAKAVGTVRIDHGEETEISWTVAPEWRGQGVCAAIIAAALPAGAVTAHIKRTNAASKRAAARNGFRMLTGGPLERWVRAD